MLVCGLEIDGDMFRPQSCGFNVKHKITHERIPCHFMCELKEIMNQNPMTELLKLYNEKDVNRFDSHLLKSLTLEAIDENWIALTGWQFYVSRAIYKEAKPSDVLDGWNLLQNEKLPVDIFTQAFYVTSLYTWLSHNSNKNVKVDPDTHISNLLVPELLELLKLCYWVNRCRNTLDSKSFLIKFNEAKIGLGFRNERKLRKQLKDKFKRFGKIGQDENIPQSIREVFAIRFVGELERFRMNLTSFTSEFMCAGLIQQQGLEVEFISTTQAKTCDFLVKSYATEVKTFLDRAYYGREIESSIEKELEATLKRAKATQDINDSLRKKAEVILMDLTFTSLGTSFAKYTYRKGIDFPISKALEEAISLAEQNRRKPQLDKIPVLVLTTLVDATKCEYSIFACVIPYPVKTTVNNGIEADYEKLSIESLI
jgi:hypothetical protein